AAEVVLAHPAHLLGVGAEVGGQFGGGCGLLLGRCGVQGVRRRVHEQRGGRGAPLLRQAQRGGGGEVPAGARAAEGEALRVDAELGGVGAGEVHGGDDVIARDRGADVELRGGAGQAAGGAAAGGFVAQPVIHRDHDGVGAAGDAASGVVALGHVEVAVLEGAAVAEHEHGARSLGRGGGGVDPQRHRAVGAGRLPALDAQVPARGPAVGRVPGGLVLGGEGAAAQGVDERAQAALHLGGGGDGAGHAGFRSSGGEVRGRAGTSGQGAVAVRTDYAARRV